MRRPFFSLVTLLLLLHTAVFPLATSSHAGLDPRAVHPGRPVQPTDTYPIVTGQSERNSTLPGEPDNIFLRIDVYGNGTAHWRIEYRIPLSDRASERTFRQFQRNLREDNTTSEKFYTRTRRSIAAAEDATGREMSMTGFDTNATTREIPPKYGVVIYSFWWHGFATVSDQRLQVGDALEGLFLGSDEHLVISWPTEYALEKVDPTPDVKRDSTVIWHGPTTFGLNGPQLLLVDRPKPASQFFPFATGAIVVALVAVLVGVRYYGGASTPLAARVFDDSSDESELLSNEEQVIRLLEEHGGRIKQQEAANELGWTTSKTSYVVSNLREEGRIHTFRIGRENILSLSDSRAVNHPET